MAQRINEDIRFYLPADPYYYQVDNLPLEDLLSNDVRLQSQIDEINSAERGNTVGRAGFTELQPFINTALPGTVSVRPGSFIGRVQRSNDGGFNGNTGSRFSIYNGRVEMNLPPTTFGSGDNPTGTYSVNNPSNNPAGGVIPQLGEGVGRNAVINFRGGNISIDSFNFNEFQGEFLTTAPLGRIDLIGIGTMNGAMDDPYLPGNPPADGAVIGDGYANLSVVKGAGIVNDNNGKRVVTIGERYITIGAPQERLNDYGRNLDGEVVPNPEFGTVPMPDDVVNVNFARDVMANGEIAQSLNELGLSNKNANFFLPLAYVFVPQSHVEGNPIPEQYMRDIRPFFRTAELSLPERQAIVGSISPSLHNPFVTESHAKAITVPVTDNLEQQIADLTAVLASTEIERDTYFNDRRISNINNVRGSRGWTQVTKEQMGFADLPHIPGLSHVQVYFFGFIHLPDSSPTIAYATAADYNPTGGWQGDGFYGKVLTGKSSGSGDNVANSNTLWVPVDGNGSFWIHINNPGWSYGLYADVQGYKTTLPILAE